MTVMLNCEFYPLEIRIIAISKKGHRILCEVSEIIVFKVVHFSANGQKLDLIYKYILALIWSSGRYCMLESDTLFLSLNK